ncbi:hypothetical protein L915_20474 [Phytophthora nicotianae]|uniref:Uncharacterized protein n=1 Tax=Phytophthora nicotianae TaxID=4792 RepID=W2FP59_PHYNI|nr:hypothetical protein L915_20474 [Phytophthora nicotianae]
MGVWEGWAASSHVSNGFPHAHAVENRPKRRGGGDSAGLIKHPF